MRDRQVDTHFYIDHAPPQQVLWVLQSLYPDRAMNMEDIAASLASDFGVEPASVRSEWVRRLYDLDLAHQDSLDRRKAYRITDLGLKVRQIEAVDPGIYPDLMHFLHYSSYNPNDPNSRKYLWSYRQCSHLAWSGERLLGTKDIAGRIQERMRQQFPDLNFRASVGARFDATAASRWRRWVSALRPPPLSADNDLLHKRVVSRFELSLLSLDDLYRSRGYRYGDPVILDEGTLDTIAAVFFLEPTCCRGLLDLAARFTKAIQLRDTFSGTAVNLLAPYGIESI